MKNNIVYKLPLGLKIAAAYLVLSGFVGLIYPLLGYGPHHPEFEAQSFVYKASSYFRSNLIEFTFLVCGIGLFMQKAWARKGALTILIISTVYASNSFAWGYAHGSPSNEVRLVSLAIIAAWNSVWFYLIYKPSSNEVLS